MDRILADERVDLEGRGVAVGRERIERRERDRDVVSDASDLEEHSVGQPAQDAAGEEPDHGIRLRRAPAPASRGPAASVRAAAVPRVRSLEAMAVWKCAAPGPAPRREAM